jgi:hypothetical protein
MRKNGNMFWAGLNVVETGILVYFGMGFPGRSLLSCSASGTRTEATLNVVGKVVVFKRAYGIYNTNFLV